MDELVRWLGEQFDEDERLARGCSGMAWWENPKNWVSAPPLNRIALVVHDGDRSHIVRHDPARVLREIDAKRKLLDEVFAYESKIDSEWGCCHDADEIAAGLCPEIQPKDITALRLLATVYQDRPGYRAEEWSP